jgi:arylamine N-acetyltransferase
VAASIATSDYLHRIGYSGAREPTAAALRDLHRAHLFTVPFENLEISLGRKIVCDEPSFLRKIVDRRRGGFCYELNGAFAALLRELGFEVTLLSARVPRESGGSTPEFDHLALRVDLEEPWLADVGFGESFLDPLRLRAGIELGTGWTQVSHYGAGWRAAGGTERTTRRLEAAIRFHADPTASRGIRGHVPLPPDVSGIALHAETPLQQSLT